MIRRNFFKGERVDKIIHIFTLTHREFGVISEGKGFTEEQSKRSAMSEAIERLYCSGELRNDFIIGNSKKTF